MIVCELLHYNVIDYFILGAYLSFLLQVADFFHPVIVLYSVSQLFDLSL